jgi:hypothetical protein
LLEEVLETVRGLARSPSPEVQAYLYGGGERSEIAGPLYRSTVPSLPAAFLGRKTLAVDSIAAIARAYDPAAGVRNGGRKVAVVSKPLPDEVADAIRQEADAAGLRRSFEKRVMSP